MDAEKMNELLYDEKTIAEMSKNEICRCEELKWMPMKPICQKRNRLRKRRTKKFSLGEIIAVSIPIWFFWLVIGALWKI